MKFVLPKETTCSFPVKTGVCGKYAQDELCRLLAKLGTSTHICDKNPGLAIVLGDAAKISAAALKKVKNNGFVSCVTETGIALGAKTEKGLLNAVYTLIEDLGVTYLMPGEKNELVSADAPFALPCGTAVRNIRFEHAGVACEFAVVTEEEYRGEEWMAYYAKLRFDIVFRHAGGHIRNDPKYGFIYGDGAHEFHHLLSKEFKEKHPETSRQSQPDDFGGDRVNDVNFCSASETAWKEIERNFRKYVSQYKELDHLILEFADLPGGGHCLCAHCRNYSASDIQTLVMNRFAEIAEKLGLKCTIQMNAYHDTMKPSKMIQPRKNIRINFCPRERCWGHPLNDASCARNAHYMGYLKAWKRYAFPYTEHTVFLCYYNDQILFRGMYPFIPDVISSDLDCAEKNGFSDFVSLQVGGQILQPDFNLLYLSAIQWDSALDKKKFCRGISQCIAGEKASVFEQYLQTRAKIFADVLKWCDVDPDICHLDYRWLKEDDSEFFRKMVSRLHKNSIAMKKAAADLKVGTKGASSKVKKLFTTEAMRAEFESEVMEGMSRQQSVNCKMPELRRTRSRKKAAVCRKEFTELAAFLQKSVETGDKAGIGKNAYYGRFVNPWQIQDIMKKIEWCDSIVKKGAK